MTILVLWMRRCAKKSDRLSAIFNDCPEESQASWRGGGTCPHSHGRWLVARRRQGKSGSKLPHSKALVRNRILRIVIRTVDESSAQEIVIECREAGYRLNGGRALISGLSLQVPRGETLVLLGRSGSGKTTTLKLINRLLDPTEGEVLVEGRATTAWDPIRLRRHIGYVIQEVGLFPHFNVERNVGLVPALEGWERSRIR